MIPLAAHLKYSATLLFFAAMLCACGGTPSYGQANTENMFRELVPGLLARTRYEIGVGAIRTQIIDLLVGPEKTSAPLALKTTLPRSGAVFEVQGGRAAVIIDGKTHPVEPGVLVRLTQNQTITIDNSRAPRPLVARLILLSAD